MTSTVLVIPVLLFLVLLVIQFALAFHAQAVLTAAAQDGARASEGEGATAEDGQRVARAFAQDQARQLIENVEVSVTEDADRVRVEVQGNVVDLIPGLELDVSGVAEGPRERFRPESER